MVKTPVGAKVSDPEGLIPPLGGLAVQGMAQVTVDAKVVVVEARGLAAALALIEVNDLELFQSRNTLVLLRPTLSANSVTEVGPEWRIVSIRIMFFLES